MPTTPNHGYNVPSEGATDWHLPLNDNFEQFDTDVEIRDADASKGSYDPKAGAKYLATDSERVYVGDGSTWQPVESTGRNPSFETISPSDGDFLGVGRSSPLTNAEYFGIRAPVSSSDFGGTYVDVDAANGKPFYGYANDGSVGAYHFYEGDTGKWKLFNGRVSITARDDGRVGVGTQSPDEQLEVRSDDRDAVRAVATDNTAVGVNAVNTAGGRAIVADGHATIEGNCRVNQQFVAAADARVDQDLRVLGNLTVDGAKNFAQAVETPAGTREVTYTAVEAPDARTEVSGVAELVDGRAEIDLPEHFGWVTDADEPVVAHVTPHAREPVRPQVTERSPEAVVVEDFGDGPDEYEVSYTVRGTRDGFADEPVVRDPDGGEPAGPDAGGRAGPDGGPEPAGGRGQAPGDAGADDRADLSADD